MVQFHFSAASHMRVKVRWREAIWNLQSSSCISELHFLTLLLNPSLQAGLNQHTSPWKVNQSDWIKQEKPWQEKCRLGLGFIERLCFSGFIRSCYAAWILECEEEIECGKEGEDGREKTLNRRDWINQKSHDRKNAGRWLGLGFIERHCFLRVYHQVLLCSLQSRVRGALQIGKEGEDGRESAEDSERARSEEFIRCCTATISRVWGGIWVQKGRGRRTEGECGTARSTTWKVKASSWRRVKQAEGHGLLLVPL